VKGYEKRKWLREILGDAIDAPPITTMDADFEDIGRLETLSAVRMFRCARHRKNCAMENVLKLYNWWSKRQESLASV